MPRQARSKSESNVYHIILRGNNHQQIFFDDDDYEKFLHVIKDCKELSGFSLYAYCIMGNHIHLLLKEKEESIALIMKRIASRYVYWYNAKYARVGHLFQGRFKSECVENEEYFFRVIRYIHQNPVKAGLCKTPSDYIYSSFGEYFSTKEQGYRVLLSLCSVGAVFKMIDKEFFYTYNIQANSDECMELEVLKPSDTKATEIIKTITGVNNPGDVCMLDVNKQMEYIVKFREKGMSIRQINRLTGISIGIIRVSIG